MFEGKAWLGNLRAGHGWGLPSGRRSTLGSQGVEVRADGLGSIFNTKGESSRPWPVYFWDEEEPLRTPARVACHVRSPSGPNRDFHRMILIPLATLFPILNDHVHPHPQSRRFYISSLTRNQENSTRSSSPCKVRSGR